MQSYLRSSKDTNWLISRQGFSITHKVKVCGISLDSSSVKLFFIKETLDCPCLSNR